MDILTIGKVARLAGVNVETIRFYERRGLVPQPPKPRQGYRGYAPDTVARIRFIRRAQEIGFTLREIDELLSLKADPAADCSNVRARAKAKVDMVNAKIAELHRVRAALDQVIAACPGRGALRTCSIIEVLDEDADTKPRPTTGGPGKGKGMKSAKFNIEGMRCEGCAETIQALVAAEPGVRTASVSFKDREARVLYDPKAIDSDRLAATIERPGYRVTGRAA